MKSNSMTVLVTGATGRIGQNMIRALLAEGNTVRALVVRREETSKLPAGVVPFVGHLNDLHVLDEACSGVDIVFHLAAIVGESKSTMDELIRVNVEGTANLLKVCKKNNIKHFIFASTQDVYGRKRSEPLQESSKAMPTDKYGHSKMLAEHEIENCGVPYTILRMPTIYGPGFDHSFFKVLKALQEDKIVIIGNGKNHLSLIHIVDVVNAMMLIKDNPEISTNKVYNVSDGGIYTQEGLVDLAAELMKLPKPRRHVQEFLVRMLARSRGLDSDELRFMTSDRVLDISRIKVELKYKPSVEIRKGVMDTINRFSRSGGKILGV